jgi:PAS domain S-box-containing protein
LKENDASEGFVRTEDLSRFEGEGGREKSIPDQGDLPPGRAIVENIYLGDLPNERFQVQIGMQRSELRYRRLFESAQDGVWIIDPHTRKILDANPFIADLLGYPYEALLGKELFEIGLLQDEKASQQAFQELQRKGYIRYEDLPLETQTGQRREVEFVSNLYQEGEKQVIQCNIRDVTARKKVEQELSEKARLLDLSNDAIIVRNLNGEIRWWSKGAENLYGWTSEEAIGKPLDSLLQTEFQKPMEEVFAQLHREGQFSGEVVQTARDGRRVSTVSRWVLDRGTESILTSHTDITKRKQMEDALRQSEERYRNLFNSIDEGLCVIEMLLDEEGQPADYRFLETNPSFCKQTGIGDAVGKRMREIAPEHEAYWFEIFGNVVLTGEPVRFIREAKELNSWFDGYAFRLGGQEKRKVAVLFRNITARIEVEEALKRAHTRLAHRADDLEQAVARRTAELSATNKQLEAFVYSIAHDLRAPLRSIRGFSAILLEEVEANLSETGRHFAHRIGKSAQFMDEMLGDLLAFSEIAQERVEMVPLHLGQVVQSVLSGLEPEVQAKQARVEMDGVWPEVLGNAPHVGAILSHFVSNALKFVAADVQPFVRLRAEERVGFVRIWVEDNGVGIAPEHQDQIFKLFTRLHGEKYPGTGIGLAIVEKGVARLGGRTGVDSAPGQGSRFWFELRKTPFGIKDPGKTILLMDDSVHVL